MTTAVKSGSTYPASVDTLLPRAVALADQIGEVPSIRRLISELRIGAPKARELAARVAATREQPRRVPGRRVNGAVPTTDAAGAHAYPNTGSDEAARNVPAYTPA